MNHNPEKPIEELLDEVDATEWPSSVKDSVVRRLSRELRQRIEREQKLVSIIQNAADGSCLRGRRGHCAELEPNSSNWCVSCQAAYVLTRS